MTEQLQSLLERLESAEGHDIEIDCALFALEHGLPTPYTQQQAQAVADAIPFYTASLDAAVALVEKVLPDLKVELVLHSEVCSAQLFTGMPGGYFNQIIHRTAALALLTAMVKAMLNDT